MFPKKTFFLISIILLIGIFIPIISATETTTRNVPAGYEALGIFNLDQGMKFVDLSLRSLTIKIKQDKFLGKTYTEQIDLPGNLHATSMTYRPDHHDVLIKYIKKSDLTISGLTKLW